MQCTSQRILQSKKQQITKVMPEETSEEIHKYYFKIT